MIPLMALVTAMRGVCSEGCTDQITCQPTKHASTKTVECRRKSGGAKRPSRKSPAMTPKPPRVEPQARRVGEVMCCCRGFASGGGGRGVPTGSGRDWGAAAVDGAGSAGGVG